MDDYDYKWEKEVWGNSQESFLPVNPMMVVKDFLFWTFLAGGLGLLFWNIFGGSGEIETIILAVVIVNAGYSFYLGNILSEQRGWFCQFEKKFEAFEQRCEGVEKKVDGVEAELRKLHQHRTK